MANPQNPVLVVKVRISTTAPPFSPRKCFKRRRPRFRRVTPSLNLKLKNSEPFCLMVHGLNTGFAGLLTVIMV